MIQTIYPLLLLLSTCLASAKPLQVLLDNTALNYSPDVDVTYPGYSLNLRELRLVQLHQDGEPVWWTELEKIQAKARGVNFMDITETPGLGYSASLRADTKPSSYPSPNATDLVIPILDTFTTSELKDNLKQFSNFRTRYYRSETGRQSEQWLLSKIHEITTASATGSLRDSIMISEFKHSWGQDSIIVKLNGSGPSNDSIVVISAHQDSTNMWPFLPAPGAGDDGSGSMVILQAYRGLIAAGFQPKRSLEFHWYSAEEGGLLGSRDVVADYERRGINVVAVTHFDMAAWLRKGTQETIGILTDYTDPALTEFCKELVDTYLEVPWTETQCGYSCSDHGSWTAAGFPSSAMVESKFEDTNPHIHSTNDRMDISSEFSFDHMLLFSKLATAFAVEVAGWSDD